MCEIKLAADRLSLHWRPVFAGSDKRQGHAGYISTEADCRKVSTEENTNYLCFSQSILFASSPTAEKLYGAIFHQ